MTSIDKVEEEIAREQKLLQQELDKLQKLQFQFDMAKELQERQIKRQEQREIELQQREELKKQKEIQYQKRLVQINNIDKNSRQSVDLKKTQLKQSQVQEISMEELKQQMQQRKQLADQQWRLLMQEKKQRDDNRANQTQKSQSQTLTKRFPPSQYNSKIEVYKKPELITIPKGVVTADDVINW